MDTKNIQSMLAAFAKERNWDQFHSPKNLSMALAGEAGELLEIFQWLTDAQSQRDAMGAEVLTAVADEIADVMIYALRLADKLDIDIEDAISSKIAKNAERYTVEASKGNAIKR